MKRKWMGVALAAAALGGAYYGYRAWSGGGREAAVYEPMAFGRGRMEMTIEATGVVEPRNRIDIKPPIAGRIEEVLVEEGRQVKKGEVMARLSSIERATLLDAARARGPEVLRKWEDAYKSTPLIAPVDGTIIARNSEPGQTVTAQDAVLVLSDRLIVNAQVDETDIGQVRAGQTVRMTLDAYPDVRVDGSVRQIAFEAKTVNNVTIYEVEIEPASIPDCMKSGMTATVLFRLAAVEDALTLPSEAVAAENGKSVVLVDGGDPATPPERWRILTGLTGGGRVEVLAGLTGTESVVRATFKLPDRKQTGSSPLLPSRRR